MKVGIIGVGMVGEVLHLGFSKLGHDVSIYDTKLPHTKIEDVLDTELVFVCVPTPPDKDGNCDTRIVENVVRTLNVRGYKGLVVIKSTVTPGTTDKLNDECDGLWIAFCPEFLREKSRFTDFIEDHDVCIIGAYDEDDHALIKAAHGDLPKQVVFVSPIEAEFAKYFSNVFNALRIVFANEFCRVCDRAGANYTAVKNAITKRRSIGDHYLESNEFFGAFGGNCLPKDTQAFANYAWKLGVRADLFDAIVRINEGKKGKHERTSKVA